MKKLYLATALFLALFSVFLTAGDRNLTELHWLAAQWTGSMGDSLYTETWTITPQGSLEGNAFMKNREGKTIFSESLRIDKIGDHIVYIAAVNKSNPVLFTLVGTSLENNKPAWVFENKEHDFPQRIIYIKVSPDSLLARVEGLQKGKEEKEEFPLTKVQ